MNPRNRRIVGRIGNELAQQYSIAVLKEAIKDRGQTLSNNVGKITSYMAKRKAGNNQGGSSKRARTQTARKRFRQGGKGANYKKIQRRSGPRLKNYIYKPDSNNADSHNNTSISRCTIKYKRQKDAKQYKALTNFTITKDTTTLSGVSVDGKQQVEVPGSIMYDKTKILALWAAAADFRNTSTTVSPSATNEGYMGQRLLLQSVTNNLRIQNQGLTNMEVDIYLCMSKHTTSSTRTPRDVWNDALQDIDGSAHITSNTVFDPFQKPTSLKAFNMQWKIVHKKRVLLEPGREHETRFSFSPNRIFDMEYCQLWDHFRGLTYRWMIVNRGTLGDTTNDVDAVGDITLIRSKYIGYQDITYKTRLLSYTPKHYSSTHNFDTTNTAVYAVNDDSGARIDATT